jgi:formate hydrogenlyase transcriptional activator
MKSVTFPWNASQVVTGIARGRVRKAGSTQTIRVNVGMVAATNGDLWKLASEKKFRSDLYNRLNVFPIPVPPLRDRAEDIPLLVRHFVSRYAACMHKQIDTIPTAVMDVLASHCWPGNIRELQNFIERSVILTPGDTLRPPLAGLKPPAQAEPPEHPATLEDTERDLICRTLRQTNGIIDGSRGAAAILGVKRTTLYSRMQRLGISRKR